MKYISTSTIKGIKYYIVRVGTQSKTFSCKKYGDSIAKQMAINYRDELVKDRDIETHYLNVSSVRYTVEHAFRRSIELYVHTVSTKQRHEKMFYKYFENYLTRELSSIKARDVIEHLNGNLNESQNILNRLKMLWKQIFNAGIMDERVLTNYADVVVVPRSNKVQVIKDKFTSENEIRLILDELKLETKRQSMHSRVIATLIIYAILLINETGMRPSECFALNKSDINFEKGVISFGNRLGSNSTEENIVVKPKTDNAIRKQPITNNLKKILEQLNEYQTHDQLFMMDNGKILNSDIVSTRISRINKKLGTHFTMYKLRHNFARDLINSENSNQRVVMDLMGHASYSQSLDYTKSTIEQQKELLESIKQEKTTHLTEW